MMIDISFHECTLRYLGNEVLTAVSFQITPGDHAVIHGPIGSGKTMILRALAGKVQLKCGVIKLISNGMEISSADFYKKVSLVEFAKPSKYFNPKNHFYQQRYHHQMEDDVWSKSITIKALLETKGYSVDDKKVKEFLARENLSGQFNNKLIHLSSGQRRKLQLIISIMELPEILLLDSPYIGLDEHSRNELNKWLLELVKDHNLQIIIAANIEDAPEWIKTSFELPPQRNASNYQASQMQHHFQNLNLSQDIKRDQNPVLKLQNINIAYGKTKLFDKVNWTVTQGERVALMGNNGSGKSTLLSLIYADNPKAYNNNIKMFGVQRGKGDSIWSIKKRIGFVSSELHLYFTENYSCAKVIATGFFDTKFIPRKITKWEYSVIEKYASYFNITDLLDREYSKTSLGEQRLILFIRALVKYPDLLLLDEPYQAFSPLLVKQANDLLDSMMKQSNTSLIFISHYRKEIPDCVDRVYHLSDGKLRIESK